MMKKVLIIFTALVIIGLNACANPSPSVLVTKDKYDNFLLPTVPIPTNAKALEPLPHVVSRLVYFYGTAPEKNEQSFTQLQAANDYLHLLTTKLIQRHGAVDALSALQKGEFYLLADEPQDGAIKHLSTMTILHSAGNNWRKTKRPLFGEPFKNCFINRLQNFPVRLQVNSDPSLYHNLAVQYSIDWNSIMLDACAQRTGNFKKPPDQRPKN